jgi:hypothetical protein
MTREIDPDDIANENLSWDEAEYLRVRGRLPEGYEMPDPPDDGDDDDPSEKEYLPSKVTPLDEQSVPVMGNQGGIVEDSGELEGVGGDYSKEEGFNNDKRRAELAKRGLSTDGNMDTMIARLRRSDADELYEDDYPAEEDE